MGVEGRRQAERDRDDAHPFLLRERVDVDDADHVVLRVGDQLVVLGLEPAEVLEPLQRRLGAPDLVQALDERQQRPVERALLDLVLLGVEVLLGAAGRRLMFSNDSKPE